MFTLPSLPKLLLLLAVVWVVWRMFGRTNRSRGGETDNRSGRRPDGNRQDGHRPSERAIEDMVQCPKCGAYVPAKGGHDCGTHG